MLNRLSQQIRSLFTRPTRRRRARFGSSERLEPREMLTTVVELVEDLNQQPNGFELTFNGAVDVNGLHFFTTSTLESGTELWRTDGTSEGTIRLTDLKNDRESIYTIRALTPFQDRIYFIASDYLHGEVLWTSDGTVDGTYIAFDIDPTRPFKSFESNLVATNEALYFLGARQNDVTQLYRLDGATGNSTLMTDFDASESYAIRNLTTSKNLVYFTRQTSTRGPEIWKLSDSMTSPELVQTLATGTSVGYVFSVAGRFLFTELTTNGDRLWSLDEAGGLSEINSIPTGNGRIYLTQSVASNNRLYLNYYSTSSFGLLMTDGTNSGSVLKTSVDPSSLVTLNGTCYFLAADGSLWASDGTIAGTASLGIDARFNSLTSRSGHLFLASQDRALWVSDGTAENTRRSQSFPSGLALWPSSGGFSGNTAGIIFPADDGSHGLELWYSGGDFSSATMITDIHEGTADADPTQLSVLGGDLIALKGQYSGTPYRFHPGQSALPLNEDDTEASYVLVGGDNVGYFFRNSLNPTLVKVDSNGSHDVKQFGDKYVMAMASHRDVAYFCLTSTGGSEFWRTDGTQEGTQQLMLFANTPIFSFEIDRETGTVWFLADDGVHGLEVWASDGTVAGTHMVKDISPGLSDSFVYPIDLYDGIAYFTINGKPWVSDGTEMGTVRLEEVESSLGIQDTAEFAVIDGVVYMSVYTDARGWEVIRTERTADSTKFVTDFAASPRTNYLPPYNLTSFRGQLAFAAWNADELGLWTSDGESSERLVSFGDNVTSENWSVVDETLFFTVNYRATGVQEIWGSDGTAEGTRRLRQDQFDVLYVPRNSQFVEYGGGIAFAAGTNEYGVEVYRVNTTIPLEAPTNARVTPQNSAALSSVHINWDEMRGANDYDIRIVNDVTRASVVQQRLATNKFDSGSLPNGSYQVLIRSRSITGDVSPWAETTPFAIGVPVMRPEATSAISTRVFQWALPFGSLSSDVWLTNRDAGTRVLYQTGVTGNSLATPSPLTPARYAVWVRSRLPGGQVTDWSTTVEFDVLAPAPTLISGSGTSNDGLPVISWTAVPGAASYQVRIQPVGSNTPLLTVSGLTATTLRVQQPMAGGRYLISIRAMKGTRQFAVPLLNQPLFVRRAPAGLKTEVRGFSWSPSPGVASYGYEIRNVRTNVVVMQGSQTSTIVQRSTAFPPGQYQARVFATYPGGVNTQWSTPLVFEEFRPALTITSAWTPTADATPSVTWNAGTDVTTYEVQAYRQGSGVIAYSATGITTASHRIANALTAGTYVIQVRANYADGSRSVWSAVRTRVIGPAPVLTQNGRTISWSSVADATHYEFWVNYVGPNAPITKAVYIPALAQTQSTMPSTLPKGRYQVWVRAIRAEGGELYAGLWGSTAVFEIL